MAYNLLIQNHSAVHCYEAFSALASVGSLLHGSVQHLHSLGLQEQELMINVSAGVASVG